MGHVTGVNDLCYTFDCVMENVWISEGARVNEWCHTYKWVMSRNSLCCRALLQKRSTCPDGGGIVEVYQTYEWMMHTYKWVMLQVSMNLVTYLNTWWNACKSVKVHVWMSHVTNIYGNVTGMNDSSHIFEFVMENV